MQSWMQTSVCYTSQKQLSKNKPLKLEKTKHKKRKNITLETLKKNKEMHVNLEMCSASWHQGDVLCGILQIVWTELESQKKTFPLSLSFSWAPFCGII